MSGAPRFFGIVPAAGRSVRMGEPKLLLPWGGRTVIESTLAAWRASRVDCVVVVVHPDDQTLADVCRRAGAAVVVPEIPPPDMRASVLAALEYVRATLGPTERDAWLLAPADMPQLDAAAIDTVIAAYLPDAPRIVAPVYAGRRGHPVLFPWPLAAEAAELGDGVGIRALLDRHPVQDAACQSDRIHSDLDTPDDYRRLHNRHRPN